MNGGEPRKEKDFRTLRVGNARIGLVGIQNIFEGLAKAGKMPSDALGEEMAHLASQRNYIVPSARGEYAKALLTEYRRYLGEDVPEEINGLSVKILGPGCPRCEQLAANVMSALSELRIVADIEHVREPKEIGRHGVLGAPALVVNGRVVTVGKVASVEEVKKMLRADWEKNAAKQEEQE